MNFLQVLLLSLLQGLTELLPVSSSAHVVIAEKLFHLDPASAEMTLLLAMFHTGTMFSVLLYYRKEWLSFFFKSKKLAPNVSGLILSTLVTLIVGIGIIKVIEKITHGSVENLFSNSTIMASGLTAAGLLILYSGLRNNKIQETQKVSMKNSLAIGFIQALCLPIRGFSRSGSTISTALVLGVEKKLAEKFSFALALILTPAVLYREITRLLHEGSHLELAHSFGMGALGLVGSFLSGLWALHWLSSWLELKKWWIFGLYCLGLAAFLVVSKI